MSRNTLSLKMTLTLKKCEKTAQKKNGWEITEDTTKATFKIITWLGERKGETECQRKN